MILLCIHKSHRLVALHGKMKVFPRFFSSGHGKRQGITIRGEKMLDKIKIAGVQMDPKLMKPKENLDKIIEAMKTTAAVRADLIIFPELCLTGYVFSDRQEALPLAESIPGPSTDRLVSLCKEFNVHVIFGLLEKEEDKLYNAAALLGPDGLIGKHRKIHLPCLGVDRFVDPGDKPFRVYETAIGKIGMQICYDLMFPESSRVLALLGADILAVPTNYSPRPWGRGNKISSYVIPARALENRVHIAAVDRIGTERGFSFVGRSSIFNALGEKLAEAHNDREEIIYGEVSLMMARQKHTVVIAKEWEVNGVEDRRPEMYGEITKSKPKTHLA
jgi:predicted amidohydrolase